MNSRNLMTQIILTILLFTILVSSTSIQSTVSSSSPNNYDLAFSTFYGGSMDDGTFSVAIDQENNIYITGFTYSDDLPMVNSWNSTFSNSNYDVFLAKFDANYHLI